MRRTQRIWTALRQLLAGLVAWSVSIEVLTQFHMWAIIIWGITLVPSILWWHSSIVWIIILSWWALVATHWGAWQAARGELLSKQQVLPQLQAICPHCGGQL